VYRPGSVTAASRSVWLAGPSLSTACDASSADFDGDKLCDSADDDDDNDGDLDVTDCAPHNALIHHGAVDTPNDGIDQDCSGADTVTCFADQDGDGFGSQTVVTSATGNCSAANESASTTDCDDAVASVHPGALDVPGDGIDQDCSGSDAAIASPGSSGNAAGGASGDAGAPGGSAGSSGASAPSAGAPAGGSGGLSGTTSSAGTSGAADDPAGGTGNLSSSGAAPASNPTDSNPSSGCACSVGSHARSQRPLTWLLMLPVFLRRARRKRSS
jgi:MYXO-CTERM domain-containing protein